MKIEVGKFYKTREGEKVRIYCADGQDDFPIHGATLEGLGWQAQEWTIDGQYHTDCEECETDIVSEWEEPRVYGEFKFEFEAPIKISDGINVVKDEQFQSGFALDLDGETGTYTFDCVLHPSYIVNNARTNSFDPDLIFTTVIKDDTTCTHSWKQYNGLMESYSFCEKCDKKESK